MRTKSHIYRYHVNEVQCLLEDAGIIMVIYLPPYSPDFNPIETAFSHVKQYLKKHDEVMAAFTNPKSIVQSVEHCRASKCCHTKFCTRIAVTTCDVKGCKNYTTKHEDQLKDKHLDKKFKLYSYS